MQTEFTALQCIYSELFSQYRQKLQEYDELKINTTSQLRNSLRKKSEIGKFKKIIDDLNKVIDEKPTIIADLSDKLASAKIRIKAAIVIHFTTVPETQILIKLQH